MNIAKDLADRLAACPVNFDPNHDHRHGVNQPPRVYFVPLNLAQEITAFLRKAA